MPTRTGLALLSLTALALTAGTVLAREGDEAAVRATLEHYLQGHATGDGAHFRLAFHPEAKLFWVGSDGALMQRTSADYAAGASGSPAPDEARRRRRVVSIDITGTAASAKIELDYPQVLLVDYMSLLKVDGRWVIVNKIFTREPKA
jgi:hypothetical protein